MTNKYFGGIVENNDAYEEVDDDLIDTVLDCVDKAEAKMNELRVADAMTEIFNIFRRCNKYIDETMPWALAKDETKKDRLKSVLYNLTEGITIGASLLHSFMPETADAILAELNTEIRPLAEMDTFGLYPNGNKVTESPKMLFARMDINELDKRIIEVTGKSILNPEPAAEEPKKEEAAVEIEHKPNVKFDDFAKLEFRVGEVIACEEVPSSKKLLRETVKIGNETRTILSGIKKWYKPEDMVGKKVMICCNLEPRKIAGEMSNGMIVAAESPDGEMISLMVPDNDQIPSGSDIC